MRSLRLPILLFCLYLASCVDNRYDLSNINSEISWGGDALTIPLASTKKIVLEEILDGEAKKMINDMNGIYGLSYETAMLNTSINMPNIDFLIPDQNNESKITFSDFDFSSFMIRIPNIKSEVNLDLLTTPNLPAAIIRQFPQKKITSKVLKLTKSEPIRTSETVELDVPTSISAIQGLNFNGTPSMTLSMQLNDANGLPLPEKLKQRIAINNFKINLPNILKYNTSDPLFNNANNQYSFQDGALPSEFSINIKAIDFGQKIQTENGVLKFDLEYSIQGEVHITGIDGLTLQELSLLNGAKINQELRFDELSIDNADIDLKQFMFQSQGALNWGSFPITGVSDYFNEIVTLRVQGDDIVFRINIQGDLLKYGDLIIPMVQIVLPDYIFVDGKHTLTYNDLKIDKNTGTTTTPIKAKIDSLHFPEGKMISSESMDIEQEVRYFIEVVKPAGALNVDEFNNELNVKLTMTTGKQEITHLRGHISTTIDYETSASLDELPDFLKNEKNTLLLPEMHLEIDLKHNIGFDVLIGFTINPIDNDGEIIKDNVVKTETISVKLPGSEEGLEFREQKLWIAATDAGIPNGYLFVPIENVANLLRQTPQKIDLSVSIIPDPRQLDFIETNKSYFINGNASFKVPFVFSSGFKLYYDETIKLDDVFTDKVLDLLFSNSNNELQLLINFYNTIPLHLNGSFVALDENSRPLDNVTITPNASKPIDILPGSEGNEKMTPVIISIKGDKSQIKKLKRLKYELLIEAKEGETSAGGAAILPTNSIRMDLKGRVLGNLSIK